MAYRRRLHQRLQARLRGPACRGGRSAGSFWNEGHAFAFREDRTGKLCPEAAGGLQATSPPGGCGQTQGTCQQARTCQARHRAARGHPWLTRPSSCRPPHPPLPGHLYTPRPAMASCRLARRQYPSAGETPRVLPQRLLQVQCCCWCCCQSFMLHRLSCKLHRTDLPQLWPAAD